MIEPRAAVMSVLANDGRKHGAFLTKRKATISEEEDDDDVIDLTLTDGTASPRKKKASHEKDDTDIQILGMTSPTTSPLRRRASTENLEEIGTRPAKLSKFPARTIGQMVSRIEWIASQDESASADTVKERFEKVFSCNYAKTTYYSHQRAWKWLRDNGVLDERKDSDLWAPLASTAMAAVKAGRMLKNSEEIVVSADRR